MLDKAKKWLALQIDAENRFAKALADPEAAQADKLRTYLQRNVDTAFGREHGFSLLENYRDYAQAVPVHDYADLEPWIMRVRAGEPGVLTTDEVISVEETSGSSGGKKSIPFTESLRREFEESVGVWLSDLARHCPAAFHGRAYWSISPPVKSRGTTAGGLPVGVGSDLGYFSEESAALLAPMMAVTPELCSDASLDPASFWRATVAKLLSCQDLSLISVWSPNFFLILDREVRRFLGDDRFCWSDRWPKLAMLSCWSDAQSAMWLPAVRARLGEKVEIQGKGLLSTEGVVSIPLSTRVRDPVLALEAHFFEFRERHSGVVSLAHEVQAGQDYEVILTTGGGLYRYATGDLVRFGEDFTLRFLGRAGRSSDLVGEKLDEPQVVEALAGSSAARFLAAVQDEDEDEGGTGYRLYLSGSWNIEADVEDFRMRLERNVYYRQAIDLGQLRPLDLVVISDAQLSGLIEKLARKQKARMGDVKLPALFRLGELEDLTDGEW